MELELSHCQQHTEQSLGKFQPFVQVRAVPEPRQAVVVQVGACEEVLVDACQSAGSGGRPLLFTFAITAQQLLPPALMAALPVNSTGTSRAARPGVPKAHMACHAATQCI